MRYALIMAGGSGTRLWPMSRKDQPKQLIPIAGGKSLLREAWDRLDGLVPPERRYICAGENLREAITRELDLPEGQYFGEPMGRDTLNALGYSLSILEKIDPQAVAAVFTSDHIIRPAETFVKTVEEGFRAVEQGKNRLLCFGITPTEASTAFGYLELGPPLAGGVRKVRRFREKPRRELAEDFLAAGPEAFLWNSGMFVWKVPVFLQGLKKFAPENFAPLTRIAEAWGTPGFAALRNEVFPALKKISVDYALMEPASVDPDFEVAAIPMKLEWKDIGSWPAYGELCPADREGNEMGAPALLLKDCRNTLTVSEDPNHLLAVLGCEDLLIIHTPGATLVCPKSRAQEIKDLPGLAAEKFGEKYT